MQLFIIIILISHITVVTAVVGCHGDRNKDHRPRQNCTAAGFQEVPVGLEPSTQVLLFPNNLFSTLTWSSFQFFTDIHEIDLTGNQVAQLVSSVTPILPSLSVLRLGWNRLTSLSDHSFSACPGLTELYLNNNSMVSLSNHTFSGLNKLEILDLSSNEIKVLPDLLLHPLSAIELLYLDKNSIEVIPEDWFSQKEMVPYLFLSDNPWICSCSLAYLRIYLEENELNIYIRNGSELLSLVKSVVCDSPKRLKNQPVVELDESVLCPKVAETEEDVDQPITTESPYETTACSTTTPTTLAASAMTATTNPVLAGTPTTTALIKAIPATAATFTPISAGVQTEYNLVTWPRSQSVTKQAYVSGTVAPLGEPQTLTSNLNLPTTRFSAPSPANTKTFTPQTPVGTTKSVPPAVTLKVLEAATTTTIRSGQTLGVGGQRYGAGVFCFWLFAGCLLLCVLSALCIIVTLSRLVVWYRRNYKSLKASLARRARCSEGVRLLTSSQIGGGVSRGGVALYRSVLFIHRDGETTEREAVGGERLFTILEPRDGARVYRKTVHTSISKEQEIEGWRDVMEECRHTVEGQEGRQRGGSSGQGISRKCYSIILREEKEEAEGVREELEWIVGGWEVKRGGEGAEEQLGGTAWCITYPACPGE